MLNNTENNSGLTFERFKRNVSEIITGEGGSLSLLMNRENTF